MSYIRHTSAPASFDDIKSLTPAKARAEVARRHEASRILLESFRKELTDQGLPPDNDINTLVDFFVYMSGKLRLERKPPPDDLPRWLEDLKDEPHFDFDSESTKLVVAIGFYLGDTLIKNFECLKWSIGRKNRVYEGQPIVVGYYQTKYRAENAVMMAANNMLTGLLLGKEKSSAIASPLSHHIKDARASLAAWKAMKQND